MSSRSRNLLKWFILSLFLLLWSSCTGAPEKRPALPYLVKEAGGIHLNTFSLAQGDFPLKGEVERLPDAPDFVRLPENEAKRTIEARFRTHRYDLKPDYPFHFGKIHVKLDGFDRNEKVGYLFLSKEDYEKPRATPDGRESSMGWFFTEKSPDHVSVPELLMLEQLNGQERVYLALINAHQFGWKAGEDETEARKAMLERLDARVDLYLMWVDARLKRRTLPDDGKKEDGDGRPKEARPFALPPKASEPAKDGNALETDIPASFPEEPQPEDRP